MANYTAADIKALRERTGAGMLDVKKALDEADGDAEKALEIIRVKGLKGVAKREGRSASDGLVAGAVVDGESGKTGILVEINCETDFVTKNEKFLTLAEQVLEAAVASGAEDVEALLAAPAGGSTVQGVVEDVILADFREQTPEPLIYLPPVGATPTMWLVGTPAYVMKSPLAASLAPQVRALIQEIAPGAPMYRIFTMEELANRSMARLRFTLLNLFIAATLALVLGAVGIYGTISYLVARRTREIGIRMALGALAADVRRMVVAQGARVAVIGVVIGLVAAIFLARSLESLLYEIEARDPFVFASVSVLMLGVAVLACYMPARRASSVDPVEAIRVE